MAITNSRKSLPESGESVEKVEVNEDLRGAEIFFENGKRIYCHLIDRDREEDFDENGNLEISKETEEMIERGIEEMKKGNTEPVDLEEDFPELFEED